MWLQGGVATYLLSRLPAVSEVPMRHPWSVAVVLTVATATALAQRHEGTTVVSNYWIGEVLIDAKGHVVEVWTIREPELRPAFPAITDAIVSALRRWEWEPLVVDKKATPFCRIWTLRVDCP